MMKDASTGSEDGSDDLQTLRGGTPAQERNLRAQGKKTLAKLLNAAMEVFGERGYHATRVDDIVSVADTSHGTFYLYFSNKEDLLGTLLQDCVEDMAALAESLGPVGPDESGYKTLRDWMVDFADLYDEYWPVIRAWAEAELEGSEFGRAGQEVLGSFAGTFVARIDEANPDGDIDAEVAALAFVAMIERFHYFVETRQIDFHRDEIADTLARVTHNGIFAGGR